ncbi:1-acyl-sn-glycerol-3-phosphate acyltransferase [Anaeromyxobacter dehalogenans]|uniref:Glycerol-3-phosphate acyltransferase n=1 Tax=Anaeromyxobacter dehalogenans (strain 2CP-C) TaxID=290397 RepID=Q2IQH8_ANADE|nr:1-acyl-sn-glycerol-3-phosphate acyltransferase [Anaeromyxobacter dehalogenans]ABC81063.1 glycerol-3-phosphate acyltransferase [Anaeromyxobacter dehalogenans 2CP-C]
MTKASDPQPDGSTPPPSASSGAGLGEGGGLLGRWFAPVKIPRGAIATLRALAARGSLVFVMRSPGLLGFLYLRWFLRRAGLPPLRAAQGFHGLAGWLARVRRTRRAFEDAVAAGESSLVFLGRPDAEQDPLAALVRQQRDLFQPVFLVPVLLVWSRRPQRLQGSIWDVLYGSPESPSALANAIAFLRAFRRAVFDVGRALDLKEYLAQRAAEPDASVALRVRGALHQHLAREFRTAVGPPLKAPSRVREKVLRDRSLRAAIEAVAAGSGRPAQAVVGEAEKDLREIASNYDPVFVGVMRALLSWFFRRLYTSVEVDEEGLARLRRAAADAPIVLCPSHKSHVDYLVLSWLLYENGMTPPHIAAGINLAFWPFGGIARRGGAFFIRRKVKGDRVYTAVLRAYVKHLLRDRFPQEFYVEGGRSRTGKLLFPKTGLVSMEVDAWLDGAADDVLFVPVAIDYERLIEASSYAKELAGGEKRKESLRGLLGAARVLLRRYERLYVQFETPISLRQLAAERLGARAASLAVDEAWGGEAERRAAPAAAAGAGEAAEAKRQLVQGLANRIAYGISRAVTITPVGLVSAALLSHVRRGLGSEEVARRVELLRYVAAEGGARFARDLAGAPSDPRQAGPIADAVRRLAHEGLVRVEVAAGDTIYQVVDEKRPMLDYHRNAVIHRYVAPALVAAAARAGGPGGSTAAEVRGRALWLSRLFKLEFMYRSGASFDEIFESNLAFLVRVRAVDCDAGRVLPGPETTALAFLADLLRAYLEAYHLAAAAAVAALGPDAPRQAPLDRRALVREAMERGRGEFLSGRIALREAISKATLENALEWLISQRVIAEEAGKLRLAGSSSTAELRAIMDGIAPHLAT